MTNVNIPESFIQWAYVQREALIRRQAEGEKVAPHEHFLGAWWWIIPPGAALFVTPPGFMLVGYALEEILNPYLRRTPRAGRAPRGR